MQRQSGHRARSPGLRERYGEQPPTERERRKIAIVRETYGWQITAEQLAWVRRKMDPAAQIKTGEEVEFEGTALRIQEQAWDEVDAFPIRVIALDDLIVFAPPAFEDRQLVRIVLRLIPHVFAEVVSRPVGSPDAAGCRTPPKASF